MMKVLFINGFLGKDAIYREPLGIMYLISAINDKHKVFILDPIKEDIDKRISEIKPDVIAYSVRTGFHQYYLSLNKKLKKKYKFISIFGGPHATFFPQMIQQDGVDCICRGEAEEAFLEILNTLEKKGDITKIKNFWVKKGKKVYKNECRPLVQNLDTIKFPERSLLDNYEEIRNAKIKSFITSRGCPYNCSYCSHALMRGLYKGQNYVRRRSVKNVIDDVREAKKSYDFEVAIFEDDTFNTSKEWIREFSREFKKLNLKFTLAGIRADLFNEETAQLLKDANCININIGIEAGNEEVRKNLLNRHTSNKQIINCVRLIKKYKMRCLTENLLSIPTSSLEDDLKTLELNFICQPNYANAHTMQPYPTTKIYKIAVEHGMCKENPFDSFGDFYAETCLNIDNKYERENLQRLFALAVRFPLIYYNIRWLIKLRLKFFYSFFYKVYKAYYGTRWWLPCKRSLKEYGNLFKRYFSQDYRIEKRTVHTKE